MNEAVKQTVDDLEVPKNPATKEFADFRDRAAYVYITGTFPTHLRAHFTALLRKTTAYHKGAVAMDRVGGHMKLSPNVVANLHLEEHPMVRKASALIKDGYTIERSQSLANRRPYGRIVLVKDQHRIIVQVDGSVRD